MSMIRHTDEPGSPAWHQRRARCFNAGDASAMLGCHPSGKTRSQLLQELHTGIEREFSDYVQEKVVNPGHRIEALWRPIAEEIIGEELYVLGGTIAVQGLSRLLGASLDGLTVMEDTAGECKSANEVLRVALPHTGRDSHARNDARQLPKGYRTQLEQQQLVTGATRTLFSAMGFDAQGNVIEERHCWYESDPALRAEIVAGWRQVDADLAAYVPPATSAAAPVGHTPDTLPALRIELMGQVTASNLAEFKATALGAIRSVNRELTTDQHFADAKQAVKWCAEVESRIKAAKEHALSQTASIEELFRTLDDVSAEARRVRLDLEKLVTRREVEIKGELVAAAKSAYDRHEAECRQDAGAWKTLMPPDFGGAIKGKRSVDSMRDALDACLANAKIAASEQARKIRANLSALDEVSRGSEHLFSDRLTFIDLTPEVVRLMVRQRITEHRAAEEKRAAELAERERERIRAEEEARAAEKVRQEQAAREAEEHRQRAAAEEEQRRQNRPALLERAREIVADIEAAEVLRDAISAQPAAANVHPLPTRAPATPAGPPTLKLGEINARLGFTVNADFLASLGFQVVATDKAAKLWHEHQFHGICAAIARHVVDVANGKRRIA